MRTHNEKYFQDMLTAVRSELMLPQIPCLEDDEALKQSLAAVMTAQTNRDKCKKAQGQAKNEEDKKKTNEALVTAEKELQEATNSAVETSTPILTTLQESSLLGNDSLDPLLVKCSILTNAMKQLAEYCKQGEEHSKLVDTLLSDVPLMRDMLYNGGAKGDNYGQAMELYTKLTQLIPSNGHRDMLQRLALGTSLEQAVPVEMFGAKKKHIDPIPRFQHYLNAYQNEELDPTFGSQSTWNFRYITDSDATDDQLTWGREMLRNYRPDMLESSDYKWRYCLIVRTDVRYRKPEWTSHPHTYDQLLNGGGKCGPRAWMGRFACKAFGIPTWGVRQPGHAAVGHWTPNESWVNILGGPWKVSYWENREGLDFVLEAQAREEAEDYWNVCRLEWIADALGEKKIQGKLNSECVWQSLALLQKHRLANVTKAKIAAASKEQICTTSIMDSMEPLDENCEAIEFKEDGTIIVPAVACSSPAKNHSKAIFNKAVFQRSFLGGMQLHIREDQGVEFTLTLKESQRYQLVFRLVTVHSNMEPLSLSVTTTSMNGQKNVTDGTVVAIPYTKGYWELTDAVEIELGSGTNVLSFTREKSLGLTLKEMILTPVPEPTASCMAACLE